MSGETNPGRASADALATAHKLSPAHTPSPLAERWGVTVAYIAQGLSYATVVTALPFFKDRYAIDDDTVALINLTVVIGAAAGSVLADRLAVRYGSRVSLIVALSAQAIALTAVAFHLPFALFWAMFGLFGIGLGGVDAGAAMQGVLAQRRLGRSVMGSFFAAATSAGIVGALTMSGAVASPAGAGVAVVFAGLVAAAAALVGSRVFDRTIESQVQAAAGGIKAKIPVVAVVLVGLVMLAAFTADSTISTWTTVYLEGDVGVAAALAPLGYAVYQGTTLISRLGSDWLVQRFGRRVLVAVVAVVGAAGLVVVGAGAGADLGPDLGFVSVLAGVGLAGLGVGALVPLAYSAAGDIEPARGDEIVARVNLFSYPGSLIGAVLPGLLSASIGLPFAYVLAAVLLVPAVAIASKLRNTLVVSG